VVAKIHQAPAREQQLTPLVKIRGIARKR